MLTIEKSPHNETRLAKELAKHLGNYLGGVYVMDIKEDGDEYIFEWKVTNGNIWKVSLDRIGVKDDGIGHTYHTYYKLKCQNAIWYVKRDEVAKLDTFAFAIKGVVDEWIKLSK